MVLFGEALVSLGSEVKVAIFNGYVLFWKQHKVKIPINQT